MTLIKKMQHLFIFVLLINFLVGCVKNMPEDETEVPQQKEIKLPKEQKIDAYPRPSVWNREKPTTIDDVIDTVGRFDLRGYDLSDLNLTNVMLDRFMFDTQTKWPSILPASFDLDKIIEFGKQPGLSIETLHQLGFTGNGVNVGIIDGRLLVNHQEFKENIAIYEEIGAMEGPAHYHGTPITSILFGNTVGVAPDANIYYIAYLADGEPARPDRLAQAIHRMIEINRKLPEGEKIRVVSISSGWNPNDEQGASVSEAVELAKQENMFIISARMYESDGLYFGGLDRLPTSDPNDIKSYSVNSYLDVYDTADDILMTPKDGRWMASPIGKDEYTMNSSGAWSMVIPYLSGVYALACEANPSITPTLFWQTAMTTGDTINSDVLNPSFHGKNVKMINPVKLIQALK